MQTPNSFNPLKSIAVPNVGRIEPRGLVVVIGPNSSGKTQMLKDIHGWLLGQPRKLVVCQNIELQRPPDLNALLEDLIANDLIRKRIDAHNNVFIDCRTPHFGDNQQLWSQTQNQIRNFYNASTMSKSDSTLRDPFLEHFGHFFTADLFLDRRLMVTNTVENFDYEEKPPANELQALYVDKAAKQSLLKEAVRVFGKAIWLDGTRGNKLCLRVAEDINIPAAEDRLEPEKMRKYRLIEDEGDGFKSYMGTCVTLLLGQRPICLIDEPELCLHPPQAYALGRFIGKYGVSTDRTTFLATHSSHILRGIVEQTTQLEIIRLSRANSRFSGKKVSHDRIHACIEKPSTKVETILDGLFAEAVTIVESEGDRLVYSTTWERLANEFRHDVHFVSVGGIGGIADTCHLYRNLKIPVCVIADLDLLRQEGIFERIVQSLTSAEQTTEAVDTCRSIVARIKALGPICSKTDTCNDLQTIINGTLDWSNTEQLAQVRKTLSRLSAGLSETARLKRGVENLRSEDVYHDLKAFLGTCRSFGLFLVECGELEDWVPSLMVDGPSKRKKPEWANVAANKIRKAPVEDQDIWAFIRQMANFQKDEASRLSCYTI
jgi:energy-coupling factor transporter ATP-binding protein EcfA2